MPKVKADKPRKFLKNLSLKTKLEIALVLFIIAVLIGYIVWDIAAHGPLTSLFDNRDQMIEFVNSLGVFGPLAFILLQILQTVVAPIPGNLVGGIGGFLFGWWGILYTTIGATIGAAGVFWLSRKFGRRLVEKVVKKDQLDKLDFIAHRRAGPLLFLIFLIPGLPDDAVCYIAGLTDVPLKKLIIIFALGRLPAVVVNNYVGMGLSDGNLTLVFVIVAVTVALLGVIYWQQENLMHLLSREYKTKNRQKIHQNMRKDLKDNGKLDNSIAKNRKKS